MNFIEDLLGMMKLVWTAVFVALVVFVLPIMLFILLLDWIAA